MINCWAMSTPLPNMENPLPKTENPLPSTEISQERVYSYNLFFKHQFLWNLLTVTDWNFKGVALCKGYIHKSFDEVISAATRFGLRTPLYSFKVSWRNNRSLCLKCLSSACSFIIRASWTKGSSTVHITYSILQHNCKGDLRKRSTKTRVMKTVSNIIPDFLPSAVRVAVVLFCCFLFCCRFVLLSFFFVVSCFDWYLTRWYICVWVCVCA